MGTDWTKVDVAREWLVNDQPIHGTFAKACREAWHKIRDGATTVQIRDGVTRDLAATATVAGVAPTDDYAHLAYASRCVVDAQLFSSDIARALEIAQRRERDGD